MPAVDDDTDDEASKRPEVDRAFIALYATYSVAAACMKAAAASVSLHSVDNVR